DGIGGGGSGGSGGGGAVRAAVACLVVHSAGGSDAPRRGGCGGGGGGGAARVGRHPARAAAAGDGRHGGPEESPGHERVSREASGAFQDDDGRAPSRTARRHEGRERGRRGRTPAAAAHGGLAGIHDPLPAPARSRCQAVEHFAGHRPRPPGGRASAPAAA
ncbi:unnamed protein product, partial [Ectocarpus sp. 4 AP-2014]